ncbi:capping complex subunit for YIEGIA [Paenibacillus sp. GYB003]|uniref:capping complex subunit for YIEGIA n=1 Tax=Paenibacillus sp. GYB003 TaxID=2994392 RepID=UPI002F968037
MGKILAVVSTKPDRVGGGAPIFIVESEREQQEIAFLLEKILDGNAHDLKNGTLILVDHRE